MTVLSIKTVQSGAESKIQVFEIYFQNTFRICILNFNSIKRKYLSNVFCDEFSLYFVFLKYLSTFSQTVKFPYLSCYGRIFSEDTLAYFD